MLIGLNTKKLLISEKKLIEKEKFTEAAESLNKILNSDIVSEKEKSYAYYLLGYIHTYRKNKNSNPEFAKRMLLSNINSNHSIPESFSHYADLINDNNVAINYLKIGLNIHPNSSCIYISLLIICDKKDKLHYIEEIDTKGIKDIYLLNKVIEVLIFQGKWEKAEIFLKKQLERKNISGHHILYYKMLYSFSLVFQEKKLLEAKDTFLIIIEKDISNELEYSPYMGAIWCCTKLLFKEEAINLFDKIPIGKGLEDLYHGPWNIIEVDFSVVYKEIFKEFCALVKDDKKRALRLKAMEAYYYYYPSELFDIYRYNKKHLSALIKYHKTDVKNLDIACAIYNMQINYKLFYNAYQMYIQMLREYLSPQENYIYGIDFLDECTESEINQIYDDAIKISKSSDDIDMDKFITDVFDKIIDYLFKLEDKEKYKKICELSNSINNYYLDKSSKLFQVAYSYQELDETSKTAEKLYLLSDAEEESSSVLNNLGVIYEKRNKLYKAEKYYKKATEIDNDEKLYIENLKRVRNILKANKEVVDSLKTENAWFLGRLAKLYETANDSGEFICTYKNRSNLLAVSPEKAEELFITMLDSRYLSKIRNNEGSSSKYLINSYVMQYLAEKKDKIRENKIYENLTEKLNVDEMNKIGYTSEIRDLLNNISSSELRDILNRDIRECAINFITNQFKACIVICGSIIESILVDTLDNIGIKKYDIGLLLNKKSKNKPVDEMTLNELLEIAKHENLLKIEEYHLSNYVRSYRNIIHPSCEIRKNYTVDEHTAKLMWYALLKIIKELLK